MNMIHAKTSCPSEHRERWLRANTWTALSGTLNTYLGTHSLEIAFVLLSSIKLQGKNAKPSQEPEELRWVSNKKRGVWSRWASSLRLRTAALCLETSHLMKLGQMREDLLYSALLLHVCWTIVCSKVLVWGRGSVWIVMNRKTSFFLVC